MILNACRTLLLASADISDVVSDRVTPHAIDQNELRPAVTMRVFSRGGQQHLSEGVKLFRSEVIMDCSSGNYTEASKLAVNCLKALVGHKGDVVVDSDTIHIRSIDIENSPTDATEGVDAGESDYRYVTSCSVDVNWIT